MLLLALEVVLSIVLTAPTMTLKFGLSWPSSVAIVVAAAATLRSELPVRALAELRTPAQFSLSILIAMLAAFPTSAREIVSVSIVLPAILEMSGLLSNVPTKAPTFPESIAFVTFNAVAASVNPPIPASDARPPSMSPLSIAIAALIAWANGATPGINDAIASNGAKSPMLLLLAFVV